MYKTVMRSFLLILVLVGCGFPHRETMYTNPLSFAQYTPRIQDGKTTEQQIREWFGNPWLVTKDSQGKTKLTYLGRGGKTRLEVAIQEGIVYDHTIFREVGGN